MILCHNGIVRGTSQDGRPVTGITVHADYTALTQIIAQQSKRPGIINIQVEVNEGIKSRVLTMLICRLFTLSTYYN